MKKAVLYARVSSKDQEREGFSIPAQLKFLREYAERNQIEIVQQFVDVETAKTTGRKQFGAMLQFIQKNSNCRAIIAEKTDRLYRNFRDCVTLEDLDVEIHLPKEGQIISKDSRSQDKFFHGIQVLLARNYVENLREETKKGMRQKAEEGVYPSRPPFGYRNNKSVHSIEIDPENAPVVAKMFELYSTGQHSLASLRAVLKIECGRGLTKGHLEKLLKNPFYVGRFHWGDKLYQGTHESIVSFELFERVQDVFRGWNRPKYRRHDFAYRGLLTCANDNCRVTAEIKKGKYVYYRCTQSRGRCDLPYIREEDLGERLGLILKDIHIPDGILAQLQKALLSDKGRKEGIRAHQLGLLQQRLAQVNRRLDQAYLDKLDGGISDQFWTRKSAEWQAEERQILASIQSVRAAKPERLLDAAKILELANKAYFLYLRQPPAEKAKLLKMVLSNCAIDSVSLYPTYRKPFDLIFQKTKTEGWLPGLDSN
jgi:DNA invertase Pin-like site-specific DNA recombinase